jgi:hypothetical protein
MIEPKLWARCRVQLNDGAIVDGKITAITKTPGGTRIRVVHGEMITTVDPIQLIKVLDEKGKPDA